jgi:hypothetical protein
MMGNREHFTDWDRWQHKQGVGRVVTCCSRGWRCKSTPKRAVTDAFPTDRSGGPPGQIHGIWAVVVGVVGDGGEEW